MGPDVTADRLWTCVARHIVRPDLAMPLATRRWLPPSVGRGHDDHRHASAHHSVSLGRQIYRCFELSGDRSHPTRLHPVKSPLIAIVDDDEALCSSLVDLMRS